MKDHHPLKSANACRRVSRRSVVGLLLSLVACGGGSSAQQGPAEPQSAERQPADAQPVAVSPVPARTEAPPQREAPPREQVDMAEDPPAASEAPVAYGHGSAGMRGRVPVIRSGNAVMAPTLTRDEIRTTIRTHLPDVRGCYEQELARDPNLAGVVRVAFEISGTGSVTSASIAEASTELQTTADCIRLAVESWVFPAPRGGGVVRVTYPFRLQT